MQQKNCDNCSYAHYLCKSSQISEFTYKLRLKKHQPSLPLSSRGTQCMRLKYQTNTLKCAKLRLPHKMGYRFCA